jgi:hypothetical protein
MLPLFPVKGLVFYDKMKTGVLENNLRLFTS